MYVYVWELRLNPCTGHDLIVFPGRDPDTLVAGQEGQSLCYSSLLPVNHISLLRDLHQLPTQQASVQLPLKLSAWAPQCHGSPKLLSTDITSPSYICPTAPFSIFRDTASNSFPQKQSWPQVTKVSQPLILPVQTLTHINVLVQLTHCSFKLPT